MMFVFLALLFALFAPAAGYAESQPDVFLKTVAFALTANDETKIEPLDQGDCVFRVNKEIYRLNNVRLDTAMCSLSDDTKCQGCYAEPNGACAEPIRHSC